MSTPVDEQTPPAAPEQQQTGTHPAVRTCERCGTVCASDQEWCLSCGVRLTDEGQRLPGIRAAATAVVLAVLLAGGAAAAAYAALRGDARDSAATGSAPSAGPIAQAQPTVTDPVPGGSDAVPTASTPTTTAKIPKTPKATPSASTPPAATPSPTPSATPSPTPAPSGGGSSSSSGSSGGSGSSSSGSSGSGSSSTSTDGVSTGTVGGKSGPITLTSGAGSVYDRDQVLADDGGTEGQAKAIDPSTSSAWKYKLNAGDTGGFGYIIDLGGRSSLKSIKITTPTSGLRAEVLGTTGTNPPTDRLNSRWKTLSTARAVSSKKAVGLKDVSGGSAAYRYVLVFFPASPASGQINDIELRR